MVERYVSNRDGAELIKRKHKQLLAERDQLNAKLAENAAALKDCAAAARLFGAELDIQPEREPSLPGIPAPSPDDTGGESIRQMTLQMLKDAGAKGTRASPIRRAIESRLGRELHYKTVGMTLYRLSEKGLARRDGFTWFITPEGMAA